jgi:hypothetical protein
MGCGTDFSAFELALDVTFELSVVTHTHIYIYICIYIYIELLFGGKILETSRFDGC